MAALTPDVRAWNWAAWASMYAWSGRQRMFAGAVAAVVVGLCGMQLADATDASGRGAQRAASTALVQRLAAARRAIDDANANADAIADAAAGATQAAPSSTAGPRAIGTAVTDDTALLARLVGWASDAGVTLLAFDPLDKADAATSRHISRNRAAAGHRGAASTQTTARPRRVAVLPMRRIMLRARGPYPALAHFCGLLVGAAGPVLVPYDATLQGTSANSIMLTLELALQVIDRVAAPHGALHQGSWQDQARPPPSAPDSAGMAVAELDSNPFDSAIVRRADLTHVPPQLLGTFLFGARRAALFRVAGQTVLRRPGMQVGRQWLLDVRDHVAVVGNADGSARRDISLQVMP